jgi:hypothetical protein
MFQACGFPVGSGHTEFEIKRPDWAWCQIAKRITAAGLKIDFIPQPRFRRSDGERLFGAGPATGTIVHDAYASCPPGGSPGLLGISWDGSPMTSRLSGRSADGIYAHLLNTAAPAGMCCALLGILPTCPVCPDGLTQGQYKEVRLRWLQEIVGSILDTVVPAGGATTPGRERWMMPNPCAPHAVASVLEPLYACIHTFSKHTNTACRLMHPWHVLAASVLDRFYPYKMHPLFRRRRCI